MSDKSNMIIWFVFNKTSKKIAVHKKTPHTARPRGTLPHETLTLMGHCFEMGPKILRYTVLHCYLQRMIKMQEF